ncbi:peptide chain release factor N(5)-glutamine methyltransferase [Rothia endophytica]|uniref:peptide chain release factor N(5)-glutamine methyltransferase n=1 Tax=Rothia endophytica TaxID=1324766 RepID=UPI001F032507|nr:peptide chain release factor N(5)-glutamine methyltransferase [Rothia endophytica]
MGEFSLQPGEELATALRRAGVYLQNCGVESGQVDAELLVAFLLEKFGKEPVSRGRVQALALMGSAVPEGFEDLINLRGDRVPLQHLTGQAHFRGLTLSVGPGVFVPRPETELLVEHAKTAYHSLVNQGSAGVVVDLCTGSGAIAASLAAELPGASVHAIELSSEAAAWAQRNLAEHGVHLVQGDALTALPELLGQVTVVASNPPYIPDGAVPKDPEVRDHDPNLALYGGGEDGMTMPRAITARAFDLLIPGGYFIIEHAETQRELMVTAFKRAGFEGIESIDDFAGEPRHTSGYKPLPAPTSVKE